MVVEAVGDPLPIGSQQCGEVRSEFDIGTDGLSQFVGDKAMAGCQGIGKQPLPHGGAGVERVVSRAISCCAQRATP